MSSPKLDSIAKYGNRGPGKWGMDSTITCADGTQLSVIAGYGAYCSPRPGWERESGGLVADDYPGPYVSVEVMPLNVPMPDGWGDGIDSVAGWIPVDDVRAFIELHGGERR